MQLTQSNNLVGWVRKVVSKRIRPLFSSSNNSGWYWSNFIETHEDPDNAIRWTKHGAIKEVKALLKKLTEIDKIVK